MPKYKQVNEDIVDTFINKLFLLVGKGLESATIRSLSKSDPELAKQMKDLKFLRDFKDINYHEHPTLWQPFIMKVPFRLHDPIKFYNN